MDEAPRVRRHATRRVGSATVAALVVVAATTGVPAAAAPLTHAPPATVRATARAAVPALGVGIALAAIPLTAMATTWLATGPADAAA